MKKIVATFLALVMMGSIVAACSKKATPASAHGTTSVTVSTISTVPIATPSPEQTPGCSLGPLPEPATNVTDEDTTPIVIYSWNDEFEQLLQNYYVVDHPDVTFDYQILSNTEYPYYDDKLDAALASGDGAPDIFLLEADYVRRYVESDNTIGILELGIPYQDLSNQIGYTYELGMDDKGSIKAMSWQANPCGVFYNRTLAETYLGSDDPAQVQKSFADWDAFLAMAQKINADSNGTVKAISGYDDIFCSYLNSREQGWVLDGEIYIDPIIDAYFDYAKQLTVENLTFNTTQWDTDWTVNMANSSVLSYWGPMWLLQDRMNFGFDEDGETTAEGANPTTGDWAFCTAPESFFWGGIWIAASRYDNNKATTADIMRYFTIESPSMAKMAVDGIFVNNISVMTAVSQDPNFGVNFLGGQNPFEQMLEETMSIDVTTYTAADFAINRVFLSVVEAYVQGDIDTIEIAKGELTGANGYSD